MESPSILILIILLCILLSGFFSSSETALISLNRYKLRTALMQKRFGAAAAEKLLAQPEQLISMILICNNIVNIAASALATIVGGLIYGDMGIAIATGILTVVLLMFAEIIPKTIASKYTEEVAYALSPILYVVFRLTTPIVWVFNIFTQLFFKLLKLEANSTNTSLSNDELRVIVKESQNLVGKEHSDMLNSILDLEYVCVEDVMVPRHEIASIDIDEDFKSLLKQLNHSSNSRVVVYRESYEHQVLGILRIKEAYRLMMETQEYTKETLIRAIDEPVYIPEGTTLTQQLYNFKKEKKKFGIVVDEYGFIIGVITIEDILEEIVGNFTHNSVADEEEDISHLGVGRYLVDGQANVRDLNKKFGWNLQIGEYRTLNGFLLEVFQDIPKVDATLTRDHLTFKVVEVNSKSIVSVEITDAKRYKPQSKTLEVNKDGVAKKVPTKIKSEQHQAQSWSNTDN